jgi:hypothetical protein
MAVLVLAPFLHGQSPGGGLRGLVEDGNGARIAAAQVEIQLRDATLIRRTAACDSLGEFRLDDLPPGRYSVRVAANGFAPATADVAVAVSTERDLIVTMRPSGVAQQVQVSAQSSTITEQPIDLSSPVHQAVASRQDLETLPLAARSFADIAYLAPGTEPVEPSDPTKARITAVSSGGSSGLNLENSVDGVDNSDDWIGGFLQNFSPDAIQQFSVRTAQEDADTSRTTGSSVVILTRRGGDEWHGEFAFYGRDAALNARFPVDNPAPNPKQPFSRQNYVATLGGPLIKDKVFGFSSLEAVHEDASIAYSPASLGQFNALAELASQGLIPGVASIEVPQNVPVPFHDVMGLMRFDWTQSQRSHWFVRGAVDNYLTHNALVQQSALPSTGATSHNNYMSLALSNQFVFSPDWLGTLVLGAGGLHLTEARNVNLGFALAFPFTSTTATTSGLETFGDNQFATPITAFPVLRNQEKYQVRYDLLRSPGRHATSIGVSLIHEPVMSGALAATAETLVSFPQDPVDYLGNPAQFTADYAAGSTVTPAGDGSFVQDVQRLGIYVKDAWQASRHLSLSYGLRWDTTYGLFQASGRDQSQNPGLLTLAALKIPLLSGVPHDDRRQFGPRVGFVYAPGRDGKLAIRAGFGVYFNDLAQNGWVTAFQAVNMPLTAPCTAPGDTGCIPGAATAGNIGDVAGSASIIDPKYKTPYAIHVTGGAEYSFHPGWTASADFVHEQGDHGYRRYQYQSGFTVFSPLYAQDVDSQRDAVPDFTVFRSDNRSSYNALEIQAHGNVTRRFNLVAHYTLGSAKTWGCVLGELFDYVNGVCNPLNAFGPGDYGPSGEDVRHRAVVAGTLHLPGGFDVTTLSQAESARPYTLTTSVPVAGAGDSTDNRAVINGRSVGMDTFYGTPYVQIDMRVSRPILVKDRWSIVPFAEFFNLLNRNNPGANYVTDVAALPVPQSEVAAGNVTDLCTNSDCTATEPITSLKQLRVAGGALGDFFGPGTTVGIPFAAQLGARISF